MEDITNKINSNQPRLSENRLLTDEQKWTIIFLIKFFSLSYQKISDCLDLGGKGTVSKIWSKYNETGTVRNLYYNCGSKRKIEDSDIDFLQKMLQDHPKSHLSDLQKELKKVKGLEISKPTIANSLKDLGYHPIKPANIPKLTQEHKDQRISYCLNHSKDKFSNVIFTDEVFFQLHNNKEVVWFRPTEDQKRPEYEKSNNRTHLKIWGAISRKKKFELLIFNGTLKWDSYLELLNDGGFFEDANKAYGIKKWRFMQDNAKPHIKQEVKEFLITQCTEIITHPPCSPDLNPIEHLWGWIKKKLSNYVIQDHDQLEIVVLGLWKTINLKKLNKFIDHHVNKLPIIIEKKGNYID